MSRALVFGTPTPLFSERTTMRTSSPTTLSVEPTEGLDGEIFRTLEKLASTSEKIRKAASDEDWSLCRALCDALEKAALAYCKAEGISPYAHSQKASVSSLVEAIRAAARDEDADALSLGIEALFSRLGVDKNVTIATKFADSARAALTESESRLRRALSEGYFFPLVESARWRVARDRRRVDAAERKLVRAKEKTLASVGRPTSAGTPRGKLSLEDVVLLRSLTARHDAKARTSALRIEEGTLPEERDATLLRRAMAKLETVQRGVRTPLAELEQAEALIRTLSETNPETTHEQRSRALNAVRAARPLLGSVDLGAVSKAVEAVRAMHTPGRW